MRDGNSGQFEGGVGAQGPEGRGWLGMLGWDGQNVPLIKSHLRLFQFTLLLKQHHLLNDAAWEVADGNLHLKSENVSILNFSFPKWLYNVW